MGPHPTRKRTFGLDGRLTERWWSNNVRNGELGEADMAKVTRVAARHRRVRRDAAPTTPDPVEIAMEAEATSQAPAGDATLLLRDQRKLIQWQIASERAGFGLKLLTAFAGLVIAAVLAGMAWRASQAGGLVVEAFVVPPAMVEDGMTGEVVARGLLDNLAKLDRETNSVFQTKVSDSWSNNTKISLAQTGVSVDDVDRLLRRWLGKETYVQGELVKTPTGVRLTARASAGAEASVEGPADQLPALTAQLAEALYRTARPNGYAELLVRRGPERMGEAIPVLREVLATSSDQQERALAHILLGVAMTNASDLRSALIHYEAATRSPDPTLAAIAVQNVAGTQLALGHSEETFRQRERLSALLRRAGGRIDEPRRALIEFQLLFGQRAFAAAERRLRPYRDRRVPGTTPDQSQFNYANTLANLHEVSAAKRVTPLVRDGTPILGVSLFPNDAWADLLVNYALAPRGVQDRPDSQSMRVVALAKLGRTDEAASVLAGLPSDCDICLAAGGVLAAARRDVLGSEAAFAEAVRLAPRNPQILLLRGRERLARGDAAHALADFEASQKLAPKWADPLAFSGEALLAQRKAENASAKFAEASQLAPRWGRLHLKWGQALAAQGKAAEARAKWRAAAAMDLTAAERAELEMMPLKRTC